MGRMMEEMDSARNTGSAELDFLHGMIPHHQSAVEMSKSYLEYAGKGGEFKGLAENIISAQNKEIDQMNTTVPTQQLRPLTWRQHLPRACPCITRWQWIWQRSSLNTRMTRS